MNKPFKVCRVYKFKWPENAVEVWLRLDSEMLIAHVYYY